MRFQPTIDDAPADAVASRGAKRALATNKLRVVLIHPKGAILPPDIQVRHIKAQNFLERLSLGASDPVSLIEINAREAEMISTFSDIFGIDFMVLTGLPNAQYDTVWNMYTQTFERISLDTLPAFLQGIHEIANSPAPADELTEAQLGVLG